MRLSLRKAWEEKGHTDVTQVNVNYITKMEMDDSTVCLVGQLRKDKIIFFNYFLQQTR